MDHLMMTPKHQVVQGSFGSNTLLERATVCKPLLKRMFEMCYAFLD
jgi:hypothetical protein